VTQQRLGPGGGTTNSYFFGQRTTAEALKPLCTANHPQTHTHFRGGTRPPNAAGPKLRYADAPPTRNQAPYPARALHDGNRPTHAPRRGGGGRRAPNTPAAKVDVHAGVRTLRAEQHGLRGAKRPTATGFFPRAHGGLNSAAGTATRLELQAEPRLTAPTRLGRAAQGVLVGKNTPSLTGCRAFTRRAAG
jgi:hypothetical protein